jgi:hypothetical protein
VVSTIVTIDDRRRGKILAFIGPILGQRQAAMKKLLFGFLWFLALYFVFCMGVGAVAGANAGSKYKNAAAAQKAGGIAGAKAVNDNFGLIVGGALMLSILGSGFGLLPGTRCRIAAQS